MRYDLSEVLKVRFPSLVPRITEEERLWAPEPVGGDILLADIFVPFLVDAFRSLPRTQELVRTGAAFIEDLAVDEDRLLRDAARISVLQALEDYPSELPSWVPELGPVSRSLLPTRGASGDR